MPHLPPADWHVQIPNGLLALLTYLLLARLVLEVAVGTTRRGRLVRGLVALTNPFVRAVGAITPRVVPGALLTPCALFWLLTARIAFAQLVALTAMLRHNPW